MKSRVKLHQHTTAAVTARGVGGRPIFPKLRGHGLQRVSALPQPQLGCSPQRPAATVLRGPPTGLGILAQEMRKSSPHPELAIEESGVQKGGQFRWFLA